MTKKKIFTHLEYFKTYLPFATQLFITRFHVVKDKQRDFTAVYL
jgi:hypothetical protein